MAPAERSPGLALRMASRMACPRGPPAQRGFWRFGPSARPSHRSPRVSVPLHPPQDTGLTWQQEPLPEGHRGTEGLGGQSWCLCQEGPGRSQMPPTETRGGCPRTHLSTAPGGGGEVDGSLQCWSPGSREEASPGGDPCPAPASVKRLNHPLQRCPPRAGLCTRDHMPCLPGAPGLESCRWRRPCPGPAPGLGAPGLGVLLSTCPGHQGSWLHMPVPGPHSGLRGHWFRGRAWEAVFHQELREVLSTSLCSGQVLGPTGLPSDGALLL